VRAAAGHLLEVTLDDRRAILDGDVDETKAAWPAMANRDDPSVPRTLRTQLQRSPSVETKYHSPSQSAIPTGKRMPPRIGVELRPHMSTEALPCCGFAAA
jgi:hypothetical protein